jgi:hypothetical protein
VRNVDEIQRFDQRGMVCQMRRDASIVRPQEVLQRQASEELMLRELLRAASVRIGRQRELRRGKRR